MIEEPVRSVIASVEEKIFALTHNPRRIFGRQVLIPLVAIAVFLFVLDGVFTSWHKGSGHHSTTVTVIAKVVFVISGLVQIVALAALLGAGAYLLMAKWRRQDG